MKPLPKNWIIVLTNEKLPSPSPIPKITLVVINRGTTDATKGVITVDNDHKSTAKHKTFLPPYLLVAFAPIILMLKEKETISKKSEIEFQ